MESKRLKRDHARSGCPPCEHQSTVCRNVQECASEKGQQRAHLCTFMHMRAHQSTFSGSFSRISTPACTFLHTPILLDLCFRAPTPCSRSCSLLPVLLLAPCSLTFKSNPTSGSREPRE